MRTANVVDSSGWLEYFTDSDRAPLFASAIEDAENLFVPIISIYEVFKKVLRERGEASVFSRRVRTPGCEHGSWGGRRSASAPDTRGSSDGYIAGKMLHKGMSLTRLCLTLTRSPKIDFDDCFLR